MAPFTLMGHAQCALGLPKVTGDIILAMAVKQSSVCAPSVATSAVKGERLGGVKTWFNHRVLLHLNH